MRRTIACLGLTLGLLTSRADGQSVLSPCDDCSSDAVDIGFTAKFFGREYSQVYVNNNGNVTFDAPLSAYTPFGLAGTTHVIIAPFFADVDTRGGGVVSYSHVDPSNGSPQHFDVHWSSVGYFGSHNDKVNTFNLSLIDRGDVAPGDFDIVFTYAGIGWETGDASGGMGGTGGSSAHVGFSNGSGDASTSFELAGSGTPGAFPDGGSRALGSHSLHSDASGTYLFEVRGGLVGQADLQLLKVWTPGSRKNEIVFTIRVDNLGPGPATDVVILDPLPSQVAFVAASPRCAQTDIPMGGPGVVCLIASLGPGEHQTVDIVVKKNTNEGFANQAAVAATEPDPDESNNAFTARVGQRIDCTDDVRIRSGPPKLKFTPTASRPSKRHAILDIKNNGFVNVDIRNIEPIDGAPFTIAKIVPALKTLKPGKSRQFLVRLVRDVGTGPAEVKRPYFRVSLECAPRPPNP